MDVVDFSKYLYKRLKEREENLTSALAAGGVKSWEEYKMTVGEIPVSYTHLTLPTTPYV